MFHADGPSTVNHASVYTARSCTGLGPVMGDESCRDQGECSLKQALHANGHLLSHHDLLHDVSLKLKKKWAAAARLYRQEHPDRMPDTKPGRKAKACTLLLPIEYARELLQTWIPWALVRIQEDFARLARRYDHLSPEQLAAIDALPEDSGEE